MRMQQIVVPVVFVVVFVLAEWWRGRPGPEPGVPEVQVLPCVVATEVGLEARGCGDPLLAAAGAPLRERRSLGLPACWWTADAERLAEIAGVGERLAERLVLHRESGGRPEAEELEGIRGVGRSLAQEVASRVDVRCGPVGAGENARSPGLVSAGRGL